MTLLDQIKLIDFYLHGVDRDIRTFLGSNEANLHASEIIAEQFRPKLTPTKVKRIFKKLYSGEITFSKATQILNGDE